MRIRTIASLASTAVVTACAGSSSEPTATSDDPVIVGSNDLTQVNADGSNIPAKYRGVIDAAGHVYPSGCTATHIGNGIALTAGHCFDAPSSRVDGRPCTGTTITWRERSGVTNRPTSTCTRILAMHDRDPYDYTIIEVSPPPVDAIPPRLNAGSSYAVGYTGTLFSHPAWRTLEWSKTCAVTPPYATSFNHTCDTEGGSSGAAMLEDSTLTVTGIHYAGAGTNYGIFLGATPVASFFNARALRLVDARGDSPFTVNRQDGTMLTFYRSREGEIRYFNESGHQSNLGGWLRGEPLVGRHPDGRLHVFAVGGDNALYHKAEQSPGGAWPSTWAPLGAWVRDPTIGTNQDGRLELYAVG
jgi:V8-like Glu-specific endopeptidase